MTMRRHFFATAGDLLSVFEQVERKHRLVYREAGLFKTPDLAIFASGADLPTLHKPILGSSQAACPRYLVTYSDAAPNTRAVPQRSGGVLYALDQLVNPDSITLVHGGFYGTDVLLPGVVSTLATDGDGVKLQRAFSSAIAKQFSRIKSYYVGEEARQKMLTGYRLTDGALSPREFDLSP